MVRQTAYTWKARLDEGGIDAWHAMTTGRPAQLDGKQLDALRAALVKVRSFTASAPSCKSSSECARSKTGAAERREIVLIDESRLSPT